MPRHEDDDFEPPRKRRLRDDDDDEEDRPRSRRRDNDDEDDRPRPKRRKRRRSSGGMSAGKAFAIVGGVFGVCAIIAVVILVSRGGLGTGGLFGASISYEKWQAITKDDTLEGLEKKFGKADRIERADWAKTQLRVDPNVVDRDAPKTLADYSRNLTQVDVWYRWRSGSEDVYVAVGTDHTGRKGLIIKGYTNAKAMDRNRGADPNNIDVSKLTPSYYFLPLR